MTDNSYTVQVRKNKFIEILPINVGCLGACTYCKTKHARGHLGSYTIDSLVSVLQCFYHGRNIASTEFLEVNYLFPIHHR